MDQDEIIRKQLLVLQSRGVSFDEGELWPAPALETKANPRYWTVDQWPERLDVWSYTGAKNIAELVGRNRRGGDMYAGFNSAIYACINTVATAYMEPPLVAQRLINNEDDPSQTRWATPARHTSRKLLRAPNRVGPDESYPVAIPMSQMCWLTQWWKHVDGTAYWLKVRSGHYLYGNVTALWPISPADMWPVGPKTSSGYEIPGIFPSAGNFIEYYAYNPGGILPEPMRIDPRNVIKFTLGVDPSNPRLGLGPVKYLAREVASDALATEFTNSLLGNSAIPGLIVVPAEGYVDADQAQEIKNRMRAEFSGGKQGGIAVLSAGAKVEQFGFEPDKMGMANIHKHCETRIAAVMNVPAIVAQLGAGIEQSAQFTNFHEAREMFAEDTMLPLWVSDALALTGQLLQDFSSRDDEQFIFDISEVRALQQDTSNLFARLQTAVRGGWMTANEARGRVGMGAIDKKKGQVPLTQGEDNRLNDLSAAGLITLNEARESVGLDPVPYGDVLIRDLAPAQVQTPPGQEGSPLGNPSPHPSGGQGGNVGATGGATEATNAPVQRQGAPVPKETPPAPVPSQRTKLPAKAAMLDLYTDLVGPDAAFEMQVKALASGRTLSDLLADPSMEETWTTLLSQS